MKKLYLLLLTIIFFKPIYAQGEAAVPTLVLQQSPLLSGAGWIGAAIPSKDASGFYYNPAQLGYFSRENNFSFFFMPKETKWIPNYFQGNTFNSYSAAAGIDLINRNGLPLSLGIGFFHNKYGFGSSNHESFSCFSAGAGFDYYLLFNVGLSIKSYSSVLSQIAEVNGTAYDFGAMITAPFADLFWKDFKLNLSSEASVTPKADFTIGYSLTNVGSKISYTDPAQSDPIPRTARLGYTFDFGIELSSRRVKNLNAVDYSFTAEAQDILIKYGCANGADCIYGNIEPGYQNILGDINISKHLIDLKGDNNVVVHRGHIFRLFETLILVSGRVNGHGYYNMKTGGFGLSTNGIFKLFSFLTDDNSINYITNHFSFEYYDTSIFTDTFIETNLKGIVINFKGLELD